MPAVPCSTKDLHVSGKQRTYSGDAREAAFLLGGIGTGNFSIGARGEMRDWEIFNNPAKKLPLPYTFTSIWTRTKGGKPVVRVVESEIQPPYSTSHGLPSHTVAGLPRLRSSKMRGEYPFVQVDFKDNDLPVKVSLEAFTPFIPLNADDSGIPAAILRYKVKNPSSKPIDISVVFSFANMVGISPRMNIWGGVGVAKPTANKFRKDRDFSGIYCTSPELTATHPTFGNMSFVVTEPRVTYKTEWLGAGWWDGAHDMWDDFCRDGKLEPTSSYGKIKVAGSGPKIKNGTIGACASLKPREEKTFQFIIAWCFPNRIGRWESDACCEDPKCRQTRNYYATKFPDSWSTVKYLLKNLPRLEKSSRDFHRALFTSTLPGYVIDAIASNITVIRSPTCFRLENGDFCGWEGCFDSGGCCHGSCTHVWNYAQTMAFLFPELERTMRRVEFGLETDDKGHMAFRTERVFNRKRWEHLPAADGQNGTIVRMYREWKLSGDNAFLRKLWPGVSRAIDFAFNYWDSNHDFVLDSQQHNTYDIEFYGPNSLSNSMFLAALKAGVEMAEFMGDTKHARKYRKALEMGSKRMDKMLWGGEYYIQKIKDVDAYRYQYGKGCLSDQLLGQFMAHVVGLGYVLPEKHVKKAMQSIFRYNFMNPMRRHHNVQRVYALGDEAGLVLCSWPRGGRPRFPFVYADEVWTGIEYHVAAHLIFEGFIDEGLTIVKTVRDRHDGYRRNPWNEVECGHHYARSMSSWAVLIALSGFKCDMVKGSMSFSPVINKDNFSTFWSTGKAWGIYKQKKVGGKLKKSVEVLYPNDTRTYAKTVRETMGVYLTQKDLTTLKSAGHR